MHFLAARWCYFCKRLSCKCFKPSHDCPFHYKGVTSIAWTIFVELVIAKLSATKAAFITSLSIKYKKSTATSIWKFNLLKSKNILAILVYQKYISSFIFYKNFGTIFEFVTSFFYYFVASIYLFISLEPTPESNNAKQLFPSIITT